jgi:site-specific DNA-methyltransferase (adenine-specific)
MNNYHYGDSSVMLRSFEDNYFDILITSPPYKDSDGYTEDLIRRVFKECYRTLKKDSLAFINFGHLAEDKFRPFRVCQILMDIGFELNETITWVKNHYRPIQGDRRVNNLTEFIFMMHKGAMPKLNRLAIGIPYADKSNVKRFAGGRDLKCRGNVWRIDYDTIQSKDEKLHNDRFPEELPELCLKLSGLKFGKVLEPFSGSGTTAIVAKRLGFNCDAMEINSTNQDIAVERHTKEFGYNL